MHMRYEDKDESQIPDSLLDEPELFPGLKLYYDAFWELCSDRPMGMSGYGPIPYSSIRRYCVEWDMNDELSSNMKRLIRRMDGEFLEWQDKRAKQNAKIKQGS